MLSGIKESKVKNAISKRKCCRCKGIDTFVSNKTGVAAWYKKKISGIWDGTSYYCNDCEHKMRRKCRNKLSEKDSNFGKGFIIEQVVSKTLGIYSCNLELDNFNAIFDLYDCNKYKDIQVRSTEPSIRKSSWKNKEYTYDVWHIPLGLPEYDTLFAVCMSEDYKNIDRMYIIPICRVPAARGLTIYKDPKTSPWYEDFRIDEKPYNDIYHSMKIDDCPVIKG